MKKNSLMSYLSLGIAFALFQVIAFAIPTGEKTATFWIAYAFSIVAFAVQIPLWRTAFGKKKSLNSKFLGIPIIHIGLTYLIVQLIAFAVFMIFPALPMWLAIIVCSILLAIFALCSITGQASASEISRLDEKVKIKRAFIQFLQIDIEMLANSESDSEIKMLLSKLAEVVRFSDPMSHEMLGDLESRIIAKVEEMKTADDKKYLIQEIETLLTERNKKSKILK